MIDKFFHRKPPCRDGPEAFFCGHYCFVETISQKSSVSKKKNYKKIVVTTKNYSNYKKL